MNRRIFIKQIAGGTAGVLATPFVVKASESAVNLTVLHTNDIHSHVEPFHESDRRYAGKGGLARIAGLVKQVRSDNPNTLLFDAGDMFQGTPFFNYFKGSFLFKLMSLVGYDAMTLGNHEFDNGLEGILEALPSANFPIINSNYDFSNTPLEGKILPYKVFVKSGIRIGVYGLGIELKGLVAKANYEEIIYLDPIEKAREMESYLKEEENCTLIVCLSHLGLRYNYRKVSDYILASETSLTDLIIGGHTHSFLNKPLELKNKFGNPILVNQAGWGGLRVGRIDYTFERYKRTEIKI